MNLTGFARTYWHPKCSWIVDLTHCHTFDRCLLKMLQIQSLLSIECYSYSVNWILCVCVTMKNSMHHMEEWAEIHFTTAPNCIVSGPSSFASDGCALESVTISHLKCVNWYDWLSKPSMRLIKLLFLFDTIDSIQEPITFFLCLFFVLSSQHKFSHCLRIDLMLYTVVAL